MMASIGDWQADGNIEGGGDQMPISCICNLCDCGRHECCSVHLVSVSGTPVQNFSAIEQPEVSEQPEGNNRCASQMRTTREEEEDSGCRCLPTATSGERYLTRETPAKSPAASRKQRRRRPKSEARQANGRGHDAMDNLSGDLDLDDELRVLVTRPAIAGKPRDNILFEGDMDLRTTFETSYEALAKMRLECWRRHQEQQAAAEAKSNNNNATSGGATNNTDLGGVSFFVDYDDNDDYGERLLTGERERKATAAKNAHETSEAAVQADMTQQPTSSSNNNNNNDNNNSRDFKPTLPASTPRDATAAAASASHQSGTRNSSKSRIIDPDLSPIVCYDANMNRLEKVGVRRRSKYRPSTSLRSGSRGLFGDQPPPPPPAKQDTQTGRETQSGATSGGGEQNQDSIEEDRVCGKTQMDQRKPWDSKPPDRSDLALESRNCQSTPQDPYSNGNYHHLMYTAANLPVDSKRRLLDNVNMVDHIKEQHIVESPMPPPPPPSPSMRQTEEPVASGESLDQVAEARETKQEEEEAKQKLISEGEDDDRRNQATLKVDTDQRKSNLKRTCQNQNFSIYDNNYHKGAEGEEDTTKSGKVDPAKEADRTIISSMGTNNERRRHNNLFNESPDYLMASGRSSRANERDNHNETDHRRRIGTSKQREDHLPPTSGPQQPQVEVGVEPGECKVFSLDHNYQYVGSRLGHKYFMEKRDF